MSSPPQPPPLDVEYSLTPEGSAFLKRVLEIEDDEELKQCLLKFQADAYAVYPYGCIRNFGFAEFRISKHPAYASVIELGKKRKNAILLDLPCCGCDSRKAIDDRYPRENVIASDLYAGDISCSILQRDIFDPNFLKPGVSPLDTSSQITSSPPSLATLKSLTPLQHHVSVIYTFHLFEHEEQQKLSHLIASLLSPLPGSIIFGSHVGASDTEEDKLGRNRLTNAGISAFAHSPSTWKNLWTGENGPFNPEQVSVQVEVIQDMDRKESKTAEASNEESYNGYSHIWSITRC